jgi:anhydro-N-acetylmuramic acid kinase
MDLIMGMNSGSSFDGIDVILAETEIDTDGFPKAPKFIKGGSYKWPKEVKNIILDAFENKIDLVGLNRLNYMVGAVFADAAAKFMRENNIKAGDITVLGLDTQTLYQESPDHKAIAEMPESEKKDWLLRWSSKKYPAGYQAGDTSVIANLLNIDTVTHFRQADHTFGGSAAPLMPYLDFILFRKEKKPVMTLNIGGIANLHLAAGDRRKMYGFDTGPGNVVSDYLVKKLFNTSYDEDGKIAASGKVNDEMMAIFMDHPFFKRPIPRSGWRLDYSSEYLNGLIEKFSGIPKEDIMATACAFTAAAVVRSMEENIPKEAVDSVENLYCSGGGIKNKAIMEELRKRMPKHLHVGLSSEIGIPPEYKEAIKFATIAYSTIHKIPGNIPAAGHASQYAILGKVAYAPRNIDSKYL